MNILITGGAGYAGSVLTRLLLQVSEGLNRNDKITVFDSFKYGIEPLIELVGRVELVKGHVRDEKQLELYKNKADVIMHLAGMVGLPLCQEAPLEAYDINVGGCSSIVKNLSKNQALIYASTGSTYGKVADVCTEETSISPLSQYGYTKAMGEKICRDAGAVCLRFATVFGVSPCMRYDLLINAFVYRAIRHKYLVLYESYARRTFIEVWDMARSYEHIAFLMTTEGLRGEVFNVGDSRFAFTKRELADKIAGKYPMQIMEAEVGKDQDARDYKVSYEKLEKLGFECIADFDKSVEKVGQLAKIVDLEPKYRFEI